jgi:protein TonB
MKAEEIPEVADVEPEARPAPPAAKPAPARSPVSSAARPASTAEPAGRGNDKGDAGAGGASADEAGPANLSSYQAKLGAHLRRFRTYPEDARRRGITGTTLVRFSVNAGGAVIAVSVARSSGHVLLDSEALAMVRRASPFPPMPKGMGQASVTISAPVRFDFR